MTIWTSSFPKRERIAGYWRLLKARHGFFDRLGFKRTESGRLKLGHVPGYQQRLALMRDKQKGRRCFIFTGDAVSTGIDVAKLRKELTMGADAIHQHFPVWGFSTAYWFLADIEQVEAFRNDIGQVRDPIKLAPLCNAYAFPATRDSLFFHTAQAVSGKDPAPRFSTDFAAVVYPDASPTLMMLQLAYHFGCNPVYLLGGDKPSAKTTAQTEKSAYALANDVFVRDGRKVYNIGGCDPLDVFEPVHFGDLFK